MNIGTAVCHVCNKRHPWAWWPSSKPDGKVRAFDNHYRTCTHDEYDAGMLYPTCDGSLSEVELVETVELYKWYSE
jgi:hypothetical protein